MYYGPTAVLTEQPTNPWPRCGASIASCLLTTCSIFPDHLAPTRAESLQSGGCAGTHYFRNLSHDLCVQDRNGSTVFLHHNVLQTGTTAKFHHGQCESMWIRRRTTHSACVKSRLLQLPVAVLWARSSAPILPFMHGGHNSQYLRSRFTNQVGPNLHPQHQ